MPRSISRLRLQVFDLIHKAVNEADGSINALCVNPVDVSLAKELHGRAPESEVTEQDEKIGDRHGAAMAVLYILFAIV